jgi:hypothetical protein
MKDFEERFWWLILVLGLVALAFQIIKLVKKGWIKL